MFLSSPLVSESSTSHKSPKLPGSCFIKLLDWQQQVWLFPFLRPSPSLLHGLLCLIKNEQCLWQNNEHVHVCPSWTQIWIAVCVTDGTNISSLFGKQKLYPSQTAGNGEASSFMWRVTCLFLFQSLAQMMVVLSALHSFICNLWGSCKGTIFTFCFALCNCLFLFSEPFDCTNTARAVHEKIKFDAIKAVFTEVINSFEVLTRLLWGFFCTAVSPLNRIYFWNSSNTVNVSFTCLFLLCIFL